MIGGAKRSLTIWAYVCFGVAPDGILAQTGRRFVTLIAIQTMRFPTFQSLSPLLGMTEAAHVAEPNAFQASALARRVLVLAAPFLRKSGRT